MSGLIKIKKRPSKGPLAPTVQDLIDSLLKVEDKSLPIFGYVVAYGESMDLVAITDIDIDISDRVDINLEMNA